MTQVCINIFTRCRQVEKIALVSERYGEIFHEPKASELYLTADECN